MTKIDLKNMFSSDATNVAKKEQAIVSFSSVSTAKKTLLQSNLYNSKSVSKTALFDFCLLTALASSDDCAVHLNSVYQLSELLNVAQSASHNIVKHFFENVKMSKNAYQSKVLAISDENVISVVSDTLRAKITAEMNDAKSVTRSQIKTLFVELNTLLDAADKAAAAEATKQQKAADKVAAAAAK